jgi:hypothetical protein
MQRPPRLAIRRLPSTRPAVAGFMALRYASGVGLAFLSEPQRAWKSLPLFERSEGGAGLACPQDMLVPNRAPRLTLSFPLDLRYAVIRWPVEGGLGIVDDPRSVSRE